MKNLHEKGFTAVELLVVIAIVCVFVVLVLFQFSKFREQQVLKSAVNDTLSSMNKARTQTLSSLNSSTYGVHFQSDGIIIFKGTVYSAGDSNNETINVTSPASISNVTLAGVSGSSGEMYFNRLYGVPSKNGTITISTSNFSRTVTISATGSASTN